jgi:6-phosphogluconate dehydrogenase (decarboxylating)
MKLRVVGPARLETNLTRRFLNGGHGCAVFDKSPKTTIELVDEKAIGTFSKI